MKNTISALVLLVFSMAAAAQSGIVTPQQYRTPGMSDSEAIRAALAASRDWEQRTLVLEGQDFLLTEAILLPSNTVVLIKNCKLKQADGVFDNVFRGDNLTFDPKDPYYYAVSVKPLEHIRITGSGNAVIEGPDVNRRGWHPFFKQEQEMVGDFWGYRTHQISLSCCRDFEISGLSFTRTRGWALSFESCSEGNIHDLEFDSRVKNGDGVDLRCGTHHCKVRRLRGYTLDDTVACSALGGKLTPAAHSWDKNAKYIYTGEPLKKIMREKLKKDPRCLDVHHIEIEDLEVAGKNHAVICLANAGRQVHHVTIKNIRDTAARPLNTVDVYTGYGTGYTPGDIHDLLIDGVSGNTALPPSGKSYAAVAIRAKVRNVTVRSVVQRGKGKTVLTAHPDGVALQ